MPPKRILIVEDEGIVAADLEDRLKRLGYEIAATVASGARALEAVISLKPDLVLMDIILQGPMDGVETANQIANRHRIPVVYLTAHADDPTMKRAHLTGPFGYVLKPFDERELHVAVEIALYRAQVENELRQVNLVLEQALAEIKTLHGLLRICAWCKRIQDDAGNWHPVEQYIKRHSEVNFTHSICPECQTKVSDKSQAARQSHSQS